MGNCLSAFLLTLLAACASKPPPAETPAPPATRAIHAPRDEATAVAIERALAGEHRSTENRARDAARHPLDTLLYFGIKPDMTVAEVWPGTTGWYTELLAPLLAEHGKLYVADVAAIPGNEFVGNERASFAKKLAARPDVYGKVTVTALGAQGGDIAPPGSCDMVVTFDNLHSWMSLGYAKQAFEAMARALKPGGILGVVDPRQDSDRPQDPRATNGYVNEDFAIRLIESAGFEMVDTSEINANPRDTKDYEQGVWALPPAYRAGNRDRDKYQSIGEPDRFTVKFRKR